MLMSNGAFMKSQLPKRFSFERNTVERNKNSIRTESFIVYCVALRDLGIFGIELMFCFYEMAVINV